MLRLDYPEIASNQISIVEAMMPPELLKLPSDLEKIDKILNDESFEKPFVDRFNVTIGRGSVPIRPYIRLMLLKRANGWGYETLEAKVNDSITLKKFCRIPLDKKAPDSTTMIKLNQKYGEDIIKDLNKLIIQKLTERKIIRGRKLRIDTTVVSSNIKYPTDAGLLKDCVNAIARVIKKAKSVSKPSTKDFRSGKRKIKKQLLKVVKVLRRRTGKAKEEVKKIVNEMALTTDDSFKSANRVLTKLRIHKNEKAGNIMRELEEVLDMTRKVIEQTRELHSENSDIRDRIVSIHDEDARPIKKGKLGIKAEFGYKLQIGEAEKGFVTSYDVYKGNPNDETLIMDAIDWHRDTFGKVPTYVTADRGYGGKQNESDLKEAGIQKIVIPRKGKKSKARAEYEDTPSFKRLKNWRAGVEARISLLKRKYGLDRSPSRGYKGTNVWIGWGILTHNLMNAARYV
jgi:IS5 family transposase